MTPELTDCQQPSTHEDDAIYFAPHEAKGRFFNPWATSLMPKFGSVLKWQLQRNPHRKEKKTPPVLPLREDGMEIFAACSNPVKVLWVGHASFLIAIDGLHLLIDPIFGHMMGMVRRQTPLPFPIEKMPIIDAVLITHGHYDHLDKRTLKTIATHWPESLFCVPKGLARVLPANCKRSIEVDWWQSVQLGDTAVSFVPAQHWYRRGLNDLNRGLWGGWLVRGSRSIYHSGDTGYFGGFKAIRRTFGPPDAAILPLGAYAPRWFMGGQHMAPDQSVQAFKDLQANHFIGMHWGTFDLSDEPIDGGVHELKALTAAEDLDPAHFHVLGHGETLSFPTEGPAHTARRTF